MKRLTLFLLVTALVLSCSKITPPTASLSVDPFTGTTETIFHFDASVSNNHEKCQCRLHYRWDWESDGHWDTEWSSNPLASHKFILPAIYNAKVEVRNEDELTDQAVIVLLVTAAEKPQLTFTDARDGHVYGYLRIGRQTWMSENLAFLPMVSPPTHGSNWVDDKKFYYVSGYNGSDAAEAMLTGYYQIYGALYNWAAAIDACPIGWHLPTDAEWSELTDFLGESAGGKMKETGLNHWDSPNTGATNESGFTALAGGHRNYDGLFYDLRIDTNYWTATIDDSAHSWGRYLGYKYIGVSRFNYYRNYGFSVRCVKNN